MTSFFSILSQFITVLLLGAYLFAAVFGIGVHAHETLAHHHDGIDEHVHDFVLHAHVDLGGSTATTAIAARESDHKHAVPTVLLAGVHNTSANQKYSSQTTSLVSLAAETFRILSYDGLVAEILPDASPPLLSHITFILPSRAPPTA